MEPGVTQAYPWQCPTVKESQEHSLVKQSWVYYLLQQRDLTLWGSWGHLRRVLRKACCGTCVRWFRRGFRKQAFPLDQVWSGIGDSSSVGYLNNFFSRRQKNGVKSVIGQEAAVTHVFVLAQIRFQSGLVFVSVHHSDRMTLSDVGVLWTCLCEIENPLAEVLIPGQPPADICQQCISSFLPTTSERWPMSANCSRGSHLGNPQARTFSLPAAAEAFYTQREKL